MSMTDSPSEIRKVSYESAYGEGFEDMEFRTPDISKINQFIGYRPTVNLDNILRRVVCYFEEKTPLRIVAEPFAEVKVAV